MIMKFIISFFIFSIPFKAFAVPWVKENQSLGVSVWRSKDFPNAMITTNEKKHASIDWEKVDSKNFFQNLSETKEESLGFIGIKNWIVDSYSWNKKSAFHELVLVGKYTDFNQKIISFIEIHHYYQFKTQQVLYIESSPGTGGIRVKQLDKLISEEFFKE
ncbi:MAG: hypothetical protein AB7I27_15830 [Bacteriovoracaceae bacterium]